MTEQEWLASKNPARMIQWASRGRSERTPGDISDRKLRLFACADFRHRALQGGNREQLQLTDLVDLWADGGPAIPREKWPETSYFVLLPDAVEAATRQCCDYENAYHHLRQVAILRDIVGNPFRPVTLPPGPPCHECGGAGQPINHCDNEKCANGRLPSPWLTPTVLSLAQAAYEERAGRVCPDIECRGRGKWTDAAGDFCTCSTCHGTGRDPKNHGTLDPFRLGLVADALMDEGCPAEIKCIRWEDRGGGNSNARSSGGQAITKTGLTPHPLLAHLRSPEPHYRGMWSLDVVLGKE